MRTPLVAIVLGLAALYLLVTLLWQLVLTFIVAGGIYYLFSPLVDLLERRIPRLAGAVIAYVFLVGALALVAWIVAPRAYAQLTELGGNLPQYAEDVERWLVEHDLAGDEADPRVRNAVGSLVERADEVALDAVNQLLATVGGFFSSLFAILLSLVLGFYLLVAGPALARKAPDWLPPDVRADWVTFGRRASGVLAGYLRARLLASVFVGTSYGIAFSLLGVNEAVLLGVVGGVMNLIPVIGPILAAIPALAVALFQSWLLVLGVLVVMVAAQQIESAVVNPYLEGHYVRLPPTVVVAAAVVGVTVAGLPGLLIATPVAGLVRAALDVFYRERWAASPSQARADGGATGPD